MERAGYPHGHAGDQRQFAHERRGSKGRRKYRQAVGTFANVQRVGGA